MDVASFEWVPEYCSIIFISFKTDLNIIVHNVNATFKPQSPRDTKITYFI